MFQHNRLIRPLALLATGSLLAACVVEESRPTGPRTTHPADSSGQPPTTGSRTHDTGGTHPSTSTTAPPVQAPVPVRSDRLGGAREFHIEPTAGPVGTTITIFGQFRTAAAQPVTVAFNGLKRRVRATQVEAGLIRVAVPAGARPGPVQVRIGDRVVWTGSFAVTRADDGLLVPTAGAQGILGVVYKLPPNTPKLPDFRTLGRPHATIVLPQLDIPRRRFDTGFPGVTEGGQPLMEWFAIRFVGILRVEVPGSYNLRLRSDDGARLYIDDKLVIDNDGIHPPQAKASRIDLTAGDHPIVVEYFQGPRFEIALELAWKNGTMKQMQPIPPEAFARYVLSPAPPVDCSRRPARACCKALTPQCQACARQAQQEMAAWSRACNRPEPRPSRPPVTRPADCTSPPAIACCEALTPTCQACKKRAAQTHEDWLRACRKAPDR